MSRDSKEIVGGIAAIMVGQLVFVIGIIVSATILMKLNLIGVWILEGLSP